MLRKSQENSVVVAKACLFLWLLYMAGKGTLSDFDIHTLNATFGYALSVYNIEVSEKLSFIATIKDVNYQRSAEVASIAKEILQTMNDK